MDDRSLLFLAAKAYGAGTFPETGEWEYFFERDPSGEDEFKQWEPHTDDGDSRRLAVFLCLVVAVMPKTHDKEAFTACYHFRGPERADVPHGDDPEGATRLAVLQVAAAIGSSRAKS